MPQSPISPEAMAAFTRVEDVQISPDGALVALVAGQYFTSGTSKPTSQIWLSPADGSSPARPWSGGPRTDTTPRWSPDGTQLAFLSDRLDDGKPQVFLLARGGRDARQLTNLPGAIEELEWSPDGTQLAFLMRDPEPEATQARKARGDDAIEVELHHRWRRVWAVDVVSGAARQVTGDAQVWEFCWMPDGGFVLLIGDEPYEWAWFTAKLARVGPDGGTPETIYSVPEKQFAFPRVSPDGRWLAFLECILSDRGINGGDVMLLDLAVPSQPPRNLSAGYCGSVWALQWRPDGAQIDYLAFEEGEAALGLIDVAAGTRITRWRAPAGLHEHYGGQFRARDTDMFAVLRDDATHPADAWVGRAASGELEWQRVTDFHPQLAAYALGETRRLSWNAADGLPITGQLILPVGYEAGQPVPLIVWVHGGPAWLWMHGFYGAGRLAPQMFAGAGYAVLLANPRGSIGWGVEFTESNIGDFGGRDYDDIIAGVDALVAQGIADPARLAIGGWSYGGFMAAWAVTQTGRFRAAIVGAGICHWRSFHGVAEIGTWDAISLRASPYEQAGRYDHFSPIHYVANVRTPTLIMHGIDDTIVPVGQGYEFFRGLKDHGAPTELVVYPREGHAFKEYAHNIDRQRRFLAWFQRYL